MVKYMSKSTPKTDENTSVGTKDMSASGSDESIRIIEKPYIISKDKLYLSVISNTENFSFAHVENGELKFEKKVVVDNKEYIPKKLPLQNGEYKKIVGIPNNIVMSTMETMEADHLFEEMKQHMKRYLDAPESEIEIFSYYALFTWFYQKINTVPYIRFLGDTGKGKSRFLKIISDLCFYPVSVDGGTSGSAIMRVNEGWHGTLVVDESDIKGGADDLFIKYFNLGFEKGKNVVKCKSNDYNSFDFFDPFCPKIIAMRNPFKDNATEGRLISITPKETKRLDIDFNLSEEYNFEVTYLRAVIARFVLFNWNKVDGNALDNLHHLDVENRIRQMAIPLSLICQLLPDKEKLLEQFVNQRQVEVKKTRSESWEGIAFNLVYALAKGDEKVPKEHADLIGNNGAIRVTPSMAASILKVSARSLTDTLKSIGMFSELGRMKKADGNSKTGRYYAVPDHDTWGEIIQRYWYDESSLECPECPEALKSKDYR
jgi:hypothetical protein